MAKPVYANSADYDNSPYGKAAVTADIEDRLAIASRDIDWLVMTAVYDTDEDGAPTDEDVAETLRDATIAQASWGIDPSAGLAAGDLPAGFTSVSLGSASMTKAKAAPEVVIGGIAYNPRVLMILHALSNEPWAR